MLPGSPVPRTSSSTRSDAAIRISSVGTGFSNNPPSLPTCSSS